MGEIPTQNREANLPYIYHEVASQADLICKLDGSIYLNWTSDLNEELEV